MTIAGLFGTWWYNTLFHTRSMLWGEPFSGNEVCHIELSMPQQYSLAVSVQLFVCWLWSYLFVDTMLATRFVSWNIMKVSNRMITRFRNIVETTIANIPRRRTRSWGEEIGEVLG